MVRVTSVEERQALARSLRHAVSDPRDTSRVVPMRVPVHPQRVAACHDVIDDITLLLHSPRPVRARGMARLRMLLSDGRGPALSQRLRQPGRRAARRAGRVCRSGQQHRGAGDAALD